jgi:transcriptional regulator with XRE-family HTH domain
MTERKKPRAAPRSPLHHKPQAVTRERERLGLTRTQLADRVGVSLSLISEIEKGTRNATPAMILRLAKELDDLDPDVLRRRPLGARRAAPQGAPQDVAA